MKLETGNWKLGAGKQKLENEIRLSMSSFALSRLALSPLAISSLAISPFALSLKAITSSLIKRMVLVKLFQPAFQFWELGAFYQRNTGT
jgi:hypothetical protein